MAARNCIMNKAAAGMVTQDRAQAARDLYDEFEAELRARNMPNARDLAEQRTLEALKYQKVARQKEAVAQLKAQDGIRARLQGKGDAAGDAALALLDFDASGQHVGPNVVSLGRTIENEAFALMDDTLVRFRARFANLDKLAPAAKAERQAAMRNVVRELFGEVSGSAQAKEMAGGISKATEYLRKLWNASGGSIPELERWGMPQTHNPRLLAAIDEPGLAALAPAARAARKAAIWADYVTPLLDRSRMIDFATGQPISDPSLRRLLLETYENIVTGGLSEVKPAQRGTGGFTGRRQQSRFLIFKDADSWLAYQGRFGNEAPFDTLIHHVRSFSRDIATLRILGTNPEGSVRYAEQLIAQGRGEAALQGIGKAAARLAGNLFSKAARFRNLWNMVSGGLSMPGNSTFAVIDETNRNVLQAAILGGATLSAVSDRAFTWANASLLGLPNGRILVRFLKGLNPASIEDQQLAARLGFGVESFLGAMVSANRYTGEIINPSVSRTLTDSILRASGLVRMTDAGRQAFQIEFLGELTRLRGVAFGDLPEGMARGFKLHGIAKADWDAFRSIAPWRDAKTGAEFLRPADLIGDPDHMQAGPLFDRRFDVATKFAQMIDAEKDLAIPSTSVRARADTLMGSRPGTALGAFMRNVATLKSFSLTLAYMHLNRAINADLPTMTRAKFAAQMILGATLLGGLAVQLKQIAAGKDPMDMSSPKFWGAAAATGGGLGIFGDFLFADVNRFGGGWSNTILGPVLGQEIPKAAKLTLGTAQQLLAKGETKGKGREIVDFARLMTPGRSLWYTSLAFDRLIVDTLQQQLDPNYSESFRRREDSARRDYGQAFFSPPGSGFPPPRAPDLSAMGR